MSSHGDHSHAHGGLPRVSAFSLETANSLSWMLGERVTSEDDRASLVGRWTRASRESVTIYEVTAETAVVRYGSPVGRDHYVGTTKDEAERAREALDESSVWTRQPPK